MDIYLDLAILLNFIVDYLLLYSSNQLCGAACNGKRMLLGAAVGAAYGALCLMPWGHDFSNGPWPFVSLGLVCLCAFGCSLDALRRGVLFFLLSMAMGGMLSGAGRVNVWAVLLALAAIWLLSFAGFGKKAAGSSYVPVTVEYCGGRAKLTALVDTGNTLRDPISGRAVLVADAALGDTLLGISEQELQKPLDTISAGKYKCLRLIPYSAVGQPAGMLLAIKPDSIMINGKKEDMLVAFAPQRIGRGRGYEALTGGGV